MRALIAGSFSPPHLGHLDLIARASVLFDQVVVGVLSSSGKTYPLSPEARGDMLREITQPYKNVRVVFGEGLLVDLVAREACDCILRGLRGPEDLAYEMQLAACNEIIGNVPTLMMPGSAHLSRISSTVVRELASYGAPLDAMVPKQIEERIYDAYQARRNTGKGVS